MADGSCYFWASDSLKTIAMKQLFAVCLITCFFASAVFGQQNEGLIQFEEKVNVHRNLPPEAADMKAMIPEFRTHPSELLFNDHESLYRNVEEEEEDEDAGGGQGVMIKMQRPEATYYRDFNSKKKVDSREFMGKTYLIEDSISSRNWKITGASKKVLGYDCLSAVTTDTSRKQEITAWFTDVLPLATGPASFGQLPGTILEVDINNGEIVLSAKKVEFKKWKKNDLVAPKKGEKISDADFKKMMDERMKEMGGRPMRIIRN